MTKRLWEQDPRFARRKIITDSILSMLALGLCLLGIVVAFYFAGHYHQWAGLGP